jgi:hypothetical protein
MPISNTPRPAYIYKSGTWYPISSPVNTAANYDWTGSHDFAAAVSFDEVVKAQAGVNNFQNPTARDAALTSPTNGLVAFIRQDNSGNVINQIQYYYNSSWVNYSAITIDEKTTSYTIALNDVDKMIKVNSSSNLEVLIPAQSSVNFPIGSRLEVYRAGTGEVTITTPGGSGVTIRSKYNNNRISVQYSGAMITKIGSDEWHLIGDLKA